MTQDAEKQYLQRETGARLEEWLRKLKSGSAPPDEDREDFSGGSDSDEPDPRDTEPHGTPFRSLESFMISGEAFVELCEAFRRWIQPEVVQKKIGREASELRDNEEISETKAATVLEGQSNLSEGHGANSVHSSPKPQDDLDLGYPQSTNNPDSVESQVRWSTTPEGRPANEMEHDIPSPDNHSSSLADTPNTSDSLVPPWSMGSGPRALDYRGALIQSLKYPVKVLGSLYKYHGPVYVIRSKPCTSADENRDAVNDCSPTSRRSIKKLLLNLPKKQQVHQIQALFR